MPERLILRAFYKKSFLSISIDSNTTLYPTIILKAVETNNFQQGEENFIKPIRTSKGKMYGMFDEKKFLLHIKDGKDERIVFVPPKGLKLIYIGENKEAEVIYILPK